MKTGFLLVQSRLEAGEELDKWRKSNAVLLLVLLGGSRGLSVAATSEVIHGAVHSKNTEEEVLNRDGEEANVDHRVGHPGQHQNGLVALDCGDNLGGDEGRGENGQEEVETRLGALEHASRDVEGANASRLDVRFLHLHFHAQRLIKTDRCELGSRIISKTRSTGMSSHGGDGHNVAVLALNHVGQEGTASPKVRVNVHVHSALDVHGLAVQEGLASHYTSIVHEDVQLVVLAKHRLRSGLNSLALAQIYHVCRQFEAFLLELGSWTSCFHKKR